MMKARIFFSGLFTVLILVGCKSTKEKQYMNVDEKTTTRVDTMIVGELIKQQKLNYSGMIVPKVSVPLSFQVPGTVSAIYVDEGDYVKKGQVIAEIDKTTLQSSYRASIAMQKQAQDAYDRLKSVYDKGSLPEIQWEEIKAKLEQANSAALISKQNLKNGTLRAPSTGYIGSKNIETGSTVIPGKTVFEVVSIKDVYVKVSVPENEINLIKKGTKALVTVKAVGNQPEQAIVDKVGVVANPVSRTYEVKLLMKNKDLTIKPGMVCDVDISTAIKNESITIPFKAIIKDENSKECVFIINKDKGNVEKRYIKTGILLNNEVQILSGISKGDILVIDGQHKLTDKQPVLY